MKSVILPEFKKCVESSEFEGMHNLEAVVLPESLERIYCDGFRDCTNLKEVIFNSFVEIGPSAFQGCFKLENIDIPDPNEKKLCSISFDTFHGCSRLKRVHLSKYTWSINSRAFYGCVSLEEINFPDELTTIENSAFAYCHSLKGIEIPDSVKHIGDNAFQACNRLEYCVLPTSVKLGDDVFLHTNFKNIYLSKDKSRVILTATDVENTRLTPEAEYSKYALNRILEENAKYSKGKGKSSVLDGIGIHQEVKKKKDEILEYDFGRF